MSRPSTMTLTLENDHLSSLGGTFVQTIHNRPLGLNKPLCCLVPANTSHLWSNRQDLEGRRSLSLGWHATASPGPAYARPADGQVLCFWH
ncbi:hypothetical protein BJX96DRAFT_148535, partial [Aspergillus floccosus]